MKGSFRSEKIGFPRFFLIPAVIICLQIIIGTMPVHAESILLKGTSPPRAAEPYTKENPKLITGIVKNIKKQVAEEKRKKEEERKRRLAQERKKKREEEQKKIIEEQKKLEREYLGKNTDSNQTQIENDVDDDPDLNKDNSDSGSKLKNDNNWNGKRLSKNAGTIQGPSGKETYYNLNMSGVVSIMRGMGFSEKEYPYHVRKDGAKCLGEYVMVAANLNLRPRGSLIETSLGMGLVCDTGGFAKHNITQLDLATNW